MAIKRLKKGVFITFEGPERCGKSTHSKLTADFLKEQGYDVLYTREPGGTVVGNKIRNVLLNSGNIEMSPLTEALLFEASRAELIKKIIKPALVKKKIVISDRFNDATIVYQGYAGRVPLKDIERIERVSMNGVRPDLTIFLDIDTKAGLEKIQPAKKDRIESKQLSFHKKVRKGYLKLAVRDKKRIRLIKTKDTKAETFKDVRREVINVVQRYKRPR